MKLTDKQLIQVKQILDKANWSGVVSHPDRWPKDGDRVCRYLDTQKFSLNAIREHIESTDLLEVFENCGCDIDIFPQAVAKWIADGLAMDRVRRFLYNPKRNRPGHGWYLPETWVFSIVG